MLLLLIQYLPRGIFFTQISIRNLFTSKSFLETNRYGVYQCHLTDNFNSSKSVEVLGT